MASRLLGGDFVGGEMTVNPTSKSLLIDFVSFLFLPGRQWMYQTCTEFGFYQTSDSANQPFGKLFPLKYVVSKIKLEAFITKLLFN